MRAPVRVAVALLALCVLALGGACPEDGQYGDDCSCTSDVAALLTAVSAPHSASCVEGVWTVTGSTTLAIGDAKWHINTDTVRLGSNFSSGSAAELYWSIDALDASHSGLLDLSGQYGDFGGFANYHVINWNRNYSQASLKVPYIRFGRRNQERNFQPRAATVVDKYRLCWRVGNTQQNTTDAQGVTFVQISMSEVEGVDCETGTTDRRWVIAFIVLLFLWGVMFGLIWLITCKIGACYERFWDE